MAFRCSSTPDTATNLFLVISVKLSTTPQSWAYTSLLLLRLLQLSKTPSVRNQFSSTNQASNEQLLDIALRSINKSDGRTQHHSPCSAFSSFDIFHCFFDAAQWKIWPRKHYFWQTLRSVKQMEWCPTRQCKSMDNATLGVAGGPQCVCMVFTLAIRHSSLPYP